MRQNKTAISTVIKQTGFAIRDWLGPFYTLGGVVTFAITMLTFLDPSGILVKSITALLVVATGVAWAVSRRRPADSADLATQAPPVHALLLVVTLFFTAGLAISEAIMSGKREPVAPAAPVAQSPPAPPVAAPLAPPAPAPQTETASAMDAAGPLGPAAVATSPVAVVPASTPAAQASSSAPVRVVPATSAKTPVATAQTKPVRPPEDRASHTTTSAPRTATTTSTTAARTPQSAADAQRCSNLIAKFSLGDTPSDADKHYLETSCR